MKLANARKVIEPAHEFSAKAEEIISAVENRLTGIVPAEQERFFAIKLLEKDDKIASQMKSAPDVSAEIKEMEDAFDDDTESIITNERYVYISSIIGDCVTKNRAKEMSTSDKIDRIVTNRWLALPIFAVIMWIVYYVSVTTVGAVLTDWTNDTLFGEWIIPAAQSFFEGIGCADWLTGLIVDGIISGVGAVLGFVPQMLVLFFFLAILESCGYMARVSVVMDPIFKRVGLSGKSIIPIIISTGCGIPGIMACRTIRDERERRATAMLTTWMPCGAKIPVISLFAGVFFAGAAWVSWLMYFVGIFLIFVGALLIKQITGHKYRKSFFIMELPEYKAPSIGRATMSMLGRAKAYIIKAATIILVCNAVVQIMQTFNWQLQVVEEGMENTSILASIATPFAVLLVPLGFGVWQLAAAAVTGFIAKENVVGTLAVVYGITNFIDTDALELVGGAGEVAATFGLTSVAALAYLMFNLYTPPCFAAIGAMNSELGSKKWLFGGIGLQLGTGYTVAFLVYQIGTLITEGHLGTGFLPGLVAVAAIIAIIAIITIRSSRKLAAEYSLHGVNPNKKSGAMA